MNGLRNGLQEGLISGLNNGLAQGLTNGLTNGLFVNEYPFDIDANKFLLAANINDIRIKNAINKLVINLKAANIWTKMKAIYPFVGGTATAHKFNLVNPLDTNAAFRLVFNGGWTHSANGALPNGTNAYADTYVIPFNNLLRNDSHISFYSRTNAIGDYFDIGQSGSPTTGINSNMIASRWSNGFFQGRVNATTNTQISNSDSRGFYVSSRLSSTTQSIYKNAVVTSSTVSSTGLAGNSINIGRWNNAGGTAYYSLRECAFASIGDGLSDAQALALYNAVQNFNTTLGRQV